MRYATIILLGLAGLQALRGELLGVLFFVALAVAGHLGATRLRRP